MQIPPIQSLPITPAAAPTTSSQVGGVVASFTELLSQVNDQQQAADTALTDLVSGKSDNIHDVVLTMAKADLSFRMVMEIRNQVLEAYKDLQRMQF